VYVFEDCRFEAGLSHGGGHLDYGHAGQTTLLRCMIRGYTELDTGGLIMESDTLEAGGARFWNNGHASVRNCWFRGPGIPYGYPTLKTGLIIEARGGPTSASVADNTIEDCDVGVILPDIDGITVENNLIRNCVHQGIRFSGNGTTLITGNRLQHCGVGIGNAPGPIYLMRVLENTVTDATWIGIDIMNDGWDLDVQGNVVLRSGGTGIRITDLETVGSARHITQNTSVGNGGSGFDLALDNPHQQTFTYDVSRNISHANGGWGFNWRVTGTGAPTLGCNDWFANAAGSTSGAVPGATDVSVDPLFCDLANNDVRLRSDSPLLGGACGTIGAHGMGCDASTEVLVALFAAEASDEGVRIRWRLGGDEEPVSAWIERSAGELGPWQSVATERTMDGAVTVDWDRAPEPGRRYWYRLAWTTVDGRTTYSSPIVIDLASTASSLALSVIGPNPASGPVAIEYVLPRSTAIDLTIHDLMGREVTRLASGHQSRGLHVTQWTGNVRGGRAAPGVYFVRLSSPDGRHSRRILLRN